MSLSDDLNAEVGKILRESWSMQEGRVVPDTTDIQLGNHAIKLRATVLYADLADSTGLVSSQPATVAAAAYKCYLNGACRVIKAGRGEITAFDGDRVMAVFLGDDQCTRAMRVGLQINHAVVKIINPRIREIRGAAAFELKQAVGIDTGELLVARTGIRGANDLVWVGPAANVAAKLCAQRSGGLASWVTKAVYDKADAGVKTSEGRPIWEPRTWAERGNASVYASGWTSAP